MVEEKLHKWSEYLTKLGYRFDVSIVPEDGQDVGYIDLQEQDKCVELILGDKDKLYFNDLEDFGLITLTEQILLDKLKWLYE